MQYRDISKALAAFLWILLLPLSLPLGIAIYTEWVQQNRELPSVGPAFLLTMLLTALLGALFWLFGKKASGKLYRREALLLVLLVYLLSPLIGAMPFYLSGTLKNPLDAYFEAVSGFTTTGATIMEPKQIDPVTKIEKPIKKTFFAGKKKEYRYFGTVTPIFDEKSGQILKSGLDAISPALLFWRSFMQWLGGGGIVILFVAILPALGVGGKVLFQTELTGPTKDSMLPRIKETASHLWKIYLFLTLFEALLLTISNPKMHFFNAITISFSTVSTGGFTPLNGGIGALDHALSDWIIMLFMLLGSINFSLYFFCMRRKFFKLKDAELRTFLCIVFVACLIATWQLIGTPAELIGADTLDLFPFFEALRNGAFQVISTQTSTGFTTANYDLWPFSVQVLLLILMFIGGMAGSTAGGIKVVRYQSFYHIMLGKIESIYRPDTVRRFRAGATLLDNRVAMTILCYFMVVACFTIGGIFILVLDGIDPETSLSTMACMLNNVGIGFRAAGPTSSFAFLTPLGKIVSCFSMIAGRLEFFALLIAFVPGFWKTTY